MPSTVCRRQAHTAEVHALRKQLESMTAQLADSKQHISDCLLAQHLADKQHSTDAARHTPEQAWQNEQAIHLLQAQSEQQSTHISSLKLKLQAAMVELNTLRHTCSYSAASTDPQATEKFASLQNQALQAASSNSRLTAQHSTWMRQLPELLHWKRSGYLLALTVLQKWAAVASAEKMHRRYHINVPAKPDQCYCFASMQHLVLQ